MDEETLRKILKEELNPIKKDIVDIKTDIVDIKTEIKEMKIEITNLKTGQDDIKDMIIDLEARSTDRHTEMNLKLEELKDLRQVTKENCYDIAKLKAVK